MEGSYSGNRKGYDNSKEAEVMKRWKSLYYQVKIISGKLSDYSNYEYIILHYDIPEELYRDSEFRRYLYRLKEGLINGGQSVVIAEIKNKKQLKRILALYKFLNEAGARVEVIGGKRICIQQ